MQKAGRDIVSILNKNCKPVETNDMIKQVATISSQSEEV
jgi:chaperonin GroEL (HSP60 family)